MLYPMLLRPRDYIALATVLVISALLLSCDSPEEKRERLITAQVDAEILNRGGTQAAKSEKEEFAGAAVIVESYEVSHSLLNDFLHSAVLDERADGLRRQMQIWSKLGDAVLVDTLVVAARSGQKASTSGQGSFMYPEKYTREKLTIRKETGGEMDSVIALTPARLMTHRFGSRLAVNPVVRENGKIEVSIQQEYSLRLSDHSWTEEMEGVSTTVFSPGFFRSSHEVTLLAESGAFYLLGTAKLPEEAKKTDSDDARLVTFARVDGW